MVSDQKQKNDGETELSALINLMQESCTKMRFSISFAASVFLELCASLVCSPEPNEKETNFDKIFTNLSKLVRLLAFRMKIDQFIRTIFNYSKFTSVSGFVRCDFDLYHEIENMSTKLLYMCRRKCEMGGKLVNFFLTLDWKIAALLEKIWKIQIFCDKIEHYTIL